MSDSGGEIKSVHSGRIRIDYARGVLLVTGADGVDQLLAGVDPVDGKVRVKLAPEGVDVKTADLIDLVWSSDAPVFKIAQSGSVSIEGVNNNTVFADIEFDKVYDKAPIVQAYAVIANESGPHSLPYANYIADAGADPFMYGVYYILDFIVGVAGASFYLDNSFNDFGSLITAEIKYYVIEDSSES